MNTQAEPHGYVTKRIHRLSAGLLGCGYFKGRDTVSQLADPALCQFEITFALAQEALFLLRLIWAKRLAGSSRLPQDAKR